MIQHKGTSHYLTNKEATTPQSCIQEVPCSNIERITLSSVIFLSRPKRILT